MPPTVPRFLCDDRLCSDCEDYRTLRALNARGYAETRETMDAFASGLARAWPDHGRSIEHALSKLAWVALAVGRGPAAVTGRHAQRHGHRSRRPLSTGGAARRPGALVGDQRAGRLRLVDPRREVGSHPARPPAPRRLPRSLEPRRPRHESRRRPLPPLSHRAEGAGPAAVHTRAGARDAAPQAARPRRRLRGVGPAPAALALRCDRQRRRPRPPSTRPRDWPPMTEKRSIAVTQSVALSSVTAASSTPSPRVTRSR